MEYNDEKPSDDDELTTMKTLPNMEFTIEKSYIEDNWTLFMGYQQRKEVVS